MSANQSSDNQEMYLSQAFHADTPGTQVFLAPGYDEKNGASLLASNPSPWIIGHFVKLPARYWHRLLIAVQEVSPSVAATLDSWSGSYDPDDAGRQLPTAEELGQIRQALQDVASRINAGDLISDNELSELGDYAREAVARIPDAVLLVFSKSLQSASPFEAWKE